MVLTLFGIRLHLFLYKAICGSPEFLDSLSKMPQAPKLPPTMTLSQPQHLLPRSWPVRPLSDTLQNPTYSVTWMSPLGIQRIQVVMFPLKLEHAI